MLDGIPAIAFASTMPTGMTFSLHESIDIRRLAALYAQNGRVRIAPFLTPSSVETLAADLRSRSDWKLVFNSGSKVLEADRSGPNAISDEQEARLRDAIQRDAVKGFQYCYDSVRSPDVGRNPADRLHGFAEFMSSPEVLRLLRTVTGDSSLAFADAQATAYRSGDFLTAHDDAVEGKNRRAAYVLGLTESWRAEWGGLLLFHGADGEIEHGFVPRLNSLSLFSVPQLHSVSPVIKHVPAHRYSVTGWLRTSA